MAITSENLKPRQFFTTNGEDIWRMEWSILGPSCELLNLETGEKKSFGLNGLTAQSFHHIEMPLIKEK